MEKENDDPLWDVALEALLCETYEAHGAALGIEQLQILSGQHTILLDDILDTLCRLTEHRVWNYYGNGETLGKPDRDMCRLLRANHRLNTVQIERLSGTWAPRPDG